jgi:RNA polymerase sigma factor (sigma-70 family)
MAGPPGDGPGAVRGSVDEGFESRRWMRWEHRCVARAKKGDRQAFAELYEAFASPLYRRVLLPRLGDVAAAEDALAETFRTALERLDQFEHRGASLWSWLCRIAINKATDMYRVKDRTRRALVNFEGLLGPLREAPEAPGAAEETREAQARMRRAVGDVLDRLNPRYRRAIELRFFEERPREDCAEILEVKLGTFDVVLLRALRAFRREWVRAFGERAEAVT